MHIHILGICGTFMGSLALLARQAGHRVTGSDSNVYPPMSTQLQQAGIDLIEGYDPAQLQPAPDLVVVGNALSRGNPCVEALLNEGLPYISGPQWLGDHFLRDKWVLAVAGTHGKTSTSAMLAWVLDEAGMAPGFLVGGVPSNFGVSARTGDTPFFIVEADEYDTAFFDKRSKFVHYHPRTLVLNNLEFDHADIFADLAAIQTQFNHLIRTVPGQGRILSAVDENLSATLERGCWSEVELFGDGGDWHYRLNSEEGSDFTVLLEESEVGRVRWQQTGRHNVHNALAAIAAARHVGVRPADACAALGRFTGVQRRMELIGDIDGIKVYDDFAHHPTAIATTLDGLRKQVGSEKIVAVIEPRSNTMKLGLHKAQLAHSAALADQVLWFEPDNLSWSLAELCQHREGAASVYSAIDELLAATRAAATEPCHIVVMSNGGFEGFHGRLLAVLKEGA